MSIRVERIPNKRGRAAILMRRSWREGKRIRKKTLANLTDLSERQIAGIDAVLRGGVAFRSLEEAFSIRRSLPHGAVAAVLGTARHLGLERMLHRSRSRMRDLALAAIAARIISPSSKLATARQLSPESATSSLGAMLDFGEVSGHEMLEMLDWLVARQRWIEGSLARRHLSGGTLILYDVSSSYMEGRQCPISANLFVIQAMSFRENTVRTAAFWFAALRPAPVTPLSSRRACRRGEGPARSPGRSGAEPGRIRARRFGYGSVVMPYPQGETARAWWMNFSASSAVRSLP